MIVLVTVGSTRFDALIQSVLSEPVLRSLRQKKYTSLVIQCGKSNFDLAESVGDSTFTMHKEGVDIELWTFKPSLITEYHRADLIISHAGSGTILDVLRLGKPLIVVPNATLLDNHQQELATSLSGLGHLVSSTVLDLPQTIENFNPSTLVPFPPFDASKFRDLLDEEMGFL